MRRLLAFLITLAIVLVGADFGLRFLSEYWVGRQLQQTLELQSRPSVSLAGFPYIPRLISGDMPTATIRTGPWTMEGVSFTSVRLTLLDVHFSTRQLLYGKRTAFTARRGTGIAVVKGLTVSTSILGRQVTLHVRFAGGRARVTSNQLPGALEASLVLDGSTLVVRSNDPALAGSFDIQLPRLIRGLRYAAVSVAGSEADVAFELSNPRFEVKA